MEKQDTTFLSDLDQIMQLIVTTKCKIHPDMHITDYCEADNKLLCINCLQEKKSPSDLTRTFFYFSSALDDVGKLLTAH